MKQLEAHRSIFSYPSTLRLRPLMVLTAGLWISAASGCGDDGDSPATPSPITCGTNTVCVVQSGPLPSNYRGDEPWDPCAGQGFSYTGTVDFADVNDFVYIGSKKHVGQGQISGTATGAVSIMLMTNDTIDSMGITSLVATCANSMNTGGTPTQPMVGTSTAVMSTSTTSTSTGTTTTTTTTTIPVVPRINCNGPSCASYPTPLPNSLNISTVWNPCAGKGFDYSGTIDLEANKDFFQVELPNVAPKTFTGKNPVSGSTEGPATLRIITDAANPSIGLTALKATCKDGSNNPGDNNGAKKNKTANLDCSTTTCKTIVNPLPHNLNADTEKVTWDPCNGGAFSYTGKIDFDDNDWIEVNKMVYNGKKDMLSAEAPGAIEVRLQTDAAGDSRSAEFVATCKDAGSTTGSGGMTSGDSTGESTGDSSGNTNSSSQGSSSTGDSSGSTGPGTDALLVCSGLVCTTPNTPLPAGTNVNVSWNPCDGKEFTYSGQINLLADDMLFIGGQTENRLNGTRTVSGRVASGPVNVRLFVGAGSTASTGIVGELRASCGGTTGPSPQISPFLDCSGDSCRNRVESFPNGLGNREASLVYWNPCNGDWFNYNGNVSFLGSDRLIIDGRRGPGSNENPVQSSQQFSGRAQGPTPVYVATYGKADAADGTTPTSLGIVGQMSATCLEKAPTIAAWGDPEMAAFGDELPLFANSDAGKTAFKAYRNWYTTNGLGTRQAGDFPAGSGIAYLGFNRAMLRHYLNYVWVQIGADMIPLPMVPNGNLPVRLVDVTTPAILANNLNSDPEINLAPAERSATTFAANGNELAIGLPRWAVNSDGDFDSPRWNAPITIDGTNYRALSDFTSPDQLGRSLLLPGNADGESYFRAAHTRIGGYFGNQNAVAEPVFYLWARHIDTILYNWLRTENGKAWATANPDHDLLNWSRFNSLEGWNFSNFAN